LIRSAPDTHSQRQRGDTTAAVRTARSALAIARACGNLFIRAYVSRGLAAAELAVGRVPPRTRGLPARRAVRPDRRSDRRRRACALGEALAHDPHQADTAEHALARAADIMRDRGHQWEPSQNPTTCYCAYHIYRDHNAPQATELAYRLGFT
jgi:hypothetical protein